MPPPPHQGSTMRKYFREAGHHLDPWAARRVASYTKRGEARCTQPPSGPLPCSWAALLSYGRGGYLFSHDKMASGC